MHIETNLCDKKGQNLKNICTRFMGLIGNDAENEFQADISISFKVMNQR